jgi:hypothetical protein
MRKAARTPSSLGTQLSTDTGTAPKTQVRCSGLRVVDSTEHVMPHCPAHKHAPRRAMSAAVGAALTFFCQGCLPFPSLHQDTVPASMEDLGDETRLPFSCVNGGARRPGYFPSPAPSDGGFGRRARPGFFFSCVDDGLGHETRFLFFLRRWGLGLLHCTTPSWSCQHSR